MHRPCWDGQATAKPLHHSIRTLERGKWEGKCCEELKFLANNEFFDWL